MIYNLPCTKERTLSGSIISQEKTGRLWRIVDCDNFFSCAELFYILRENYGILGLGTIRKNRLRGADAAMPLKAFRYKIYEGLKKNRRAVIDPLDIKNRPHKAIQAVSVEFSRFDNVGHFMSMTSQRRCRLCSKLTTVTCSKCQARLCYVIGSKPRNCQIICHFKK
ncbi:unnamed protein product [Leptidea sinapis]|uniref:PiggyBac transposable element-derived protein domain-containing protein n=1 Tax=Leptidea sinapis TaxID=189913 RepID=A0A5E4QZI8_9NEOP|nr:unnamed protein product [Leptidea sinapis]